MHANRTLLIIIKLQNRWHQRNQRQPSMILRWVCVRWAWPMPAWVMMTNRMRKHFKHLVRGTVRAQIWHLTSKNWKVEALNSKGTKSINKLFSRLYKQIFEPLPTNIRYAQGDASNSVSRYGCDKRAQRHPIVDGILFGSCKCDFYVLCILVDRHFHKHYNDLNPHF